MRKTKPYRSHEEATIESFRRDPEFAAEYLNAVLADGDQEELLVALRRVAAAFGGCRRWRNRPNSTPRRFIGRSRPRATPN